jgi:hypothetical protein
MVTTRRPRFYSSLKQIMELVFLKKNHLTVKAGFGGFVVYI